MIPIRRKIMMGFGGAMAVLFALFWIGCWSLLRIQNSYEWVSHTYDVIAHIRQIDSDLHEAQAGLRGFLLTHQPSFLESARPRVSFVLGDAYETSQLTADNPRQRENFQRLAPLLNETVGRIQDSIRLCSSGRVKEALGLLRSGNLSQDNQTLEKVIGQMVAEEQNLLSERQRMLSQRIHFALVMFILGCAFFMAFFAVDLWVINREIRHKERTQEILRREEYQLFQYLEAVPLGIFVVNKSGQPYYANQKAKEILGRSIEPGASSQTLGEVYQVYRAGTQEPYPVSQLPSARGLRGEKAMVEDLEIRRPDGTIVPLQVWSTPVLNTAGEIQYSMTVFGDIAERKQVEEMKQNLISIVSHQLKTPVGEINGYIENLLEGVAGELGVKQKDYLLDMREIGLDNYRLISDLLSISKIERGLLNVDARKVSLKRMVNMALRDYEKIIQRKGLALTLEGLDESLEVTADPEKLIETLRNLVNNAIKFTDKGGIALKAERVGAFVHLSLQDTGMGISEASLAQLFSRKKVLGAEASRAGAGLGLYVAKYFMKLMGGDITATTEKGKGSCFTLTIPVA
jgi:PAS domain S-box-containing protein